MISNRTKREVFDFLWENSGTAHANHPTWIEFRKSTRYFATSYSLPPAPDLDFPGTDLYYVSGKTKICWIDKHDDALRPLLEWWENR